MGKFYTNASTQLFELSLDKISSTLSVSLAENLVIISSKLDRLSFDWLNEASVNEEALREI